ncbi:tRNA dihydrouridine(20/20a) synthase DusA [Moraxella ovis]|uniref:tRNA dihydrouridine(20/20a) synthase DusA n=1 Tax=Moraxella ovis TaxID=29433 RepID=UPI000D88A0EE|nr:tRNA dihydrouridine(20/20a) synthase DusA [Moraxella ovis]SPX84898.1 Probable tRNA-dihydrouridine synthase [Moraxella ovis]STZ06746.1 Probable tRNA-dihydrouridine synthase [Moraxella ovis]
MLSLQDALKSNTKRISVAPMIDWTTSDFRFFARLFNRHIHLYTEMISTSAILKGDTDYILRYDDSEHPVVLQLGGSSPSEMAHCVQIADKMGYDEFNINVGCPSDRVQHNKIGACLMAEPALVADMVRAMKGSTDKSVTVKHRIGIDTFDSYEFMRDFVGTVADAGCTHFITHARIAWLNGLSPKENREIPPLRYDDIYRLKREFPHLFIEINGGVDNLDGIKTHLTHVDGVMIGRAFYHNPMLMGVCNELWGEPIPTHREILENLYPYLEKRAEQGANLATLTRHYLGLFQGLAGARKWRQDLSGKRNLTVDDIRNSAETVLALNGQ